MLNKTALMGRLTATPELRYTPSNVAVATFTLAVNRSFVKQGEERQSDFIEIVTWKNTAEFVSKYFGKGQMMAIDGRIQTRSYTDKEGKKRKAFEVIADNVYFCGDKSDSSRANTNANVEVSSNDFTPVEDDDDLPFYI